MTFEEWRDYYVLLTKHELGTEDLRECYEAGWNSCADLSDATIKSLKAENEELRDLITGLYEDAAGEDI